MSLITNQNIDTPNKDTSGQVGNVTPVDKIDPSQSKQFSSLLEEKEAKSQTEESLDDGEISPEELQRQIRENLFKNGFNKAMEKAKEMRDELKKG